jgi:hypothetical protein
MIWFLSSSGNFFIDAASPQSGTVHQKLYDKDGTETDDVNKAVKVNWDVQEGTRPSKTIQTLQ